MIDADRMRDRLAELISAHAVPGATLGVLDQGETTVVAAGVLGRATGVEATPDSLFQIGSITKVWTATLVLQLVDEGLLDLDAPVRDALPAFRVADPEASRSVTPRELLTHTSGIDGDVFTDTGRGDNCVERYVAELARVAQTHPPGATWSYCNAGYVVAGRIVEVLRRTTWDAALRQSLSGPLGLRHTVTLPEEALLHRTAVGHVARPGDDPEPVSTWMLPRSVSPAGLVVASAGDVLEVVRMHLAGGEGPDGTRILSETSVDAMAASQVELPDTLTLGDSWGLGWIRYDWGGTRLIGHDGNTVGQSAFLRVLPERRLAVALLTNADAPLDLYREVYGELFAELAGVSPPPPIAPPDSPPPYDPERYVGRYERSSSLTEVFRRGDDLVLRSTTTGPLAALVPEPVREFPLSPLGNDLFVLHLPESDTWRAVLFYELTDGARYVHYGGRATRLLP